MYIADNETAANTYDLNTVGTGGATDEHKFHNPIYSELNPQTGTGSSDDRAFTNSLYESTNIQTDQDYSQLRCPDVTPPSHTVRTDTCELTSTTDHHSFDVANFPNKPNEGGIYDTADHTPPPLPAGTFDEDYSKLRQPVTNTTLQPPTLRTLNESLNQPVYDEAFPPIDDSPSEKKTRHPSKSHGAYEEIDDKDISRNLPPGVYDKTFHQPVNIPSENTYSKLGQLEPELPAYDVANNHHPQQLQDKAPPPNGSMYDTADYSPELKTKSKHNYIETSEFVGAPMESPSHTYDYADTKKSSSSVKYSYDYIDNPVPGGRVVPPTVIPPAESVYTNTTPGKVSQEAESHYDMGQ